MLPNAHPAGTDIPNVSLKLKFKKWPKILCIFGLCCQSLRGNRIKNFMWCVLICAWKFRFLILGDLPLQNFRAKNLGFNFAVLGFYRIYLQKATRYHESGNGIANYNAFLTLRHFCAQICSHSLLWQQVESRHNFTNARQWWMVTNAPLARMEIANIS